MQCYIVKTKKIISNNSKENLKYYFKTIAVKKLEEVYYLCLNSVYQNTM